MTIQVRNGRFRLRLPIPVGLARFVVDWIPERVFEELAEGEKNVKLDKTVICELLDAVGEMGREYRGLEVVRVEEHGGALVSIKL